MYYIFYIYLHIFIYTYVCVYYMYVHVHLLINFLLTQHMHTPISVTCIFCKLRHTLTSCLKQNMSRKSRTACSQRTLLHLNWDPREQ